MKPWYKSTSYWMLYCAMAFPVTIKSIVTCFLHPWPGPLWLVVCGELIGIVGLIPSTVFA